MMRIAFLSLVIFLSASIHAQNLQNLLSGKTYQRTFYPVGLKHTATYQFYDDKVVYKVDGFFVHDKYEIIGKYHNDRFVGYSPETKTNYILFIKIKSPSLIMINKQGHDPRYSAILRDKPVDGWHTYKLKR